MMNQIAIGLGAGLASALLYFAVASGTALAVALFYLAPLPIVVAGLGWGWTTGLVAAVSGAVLAGAATTPLLGAVFLIACSAPAAWLARLALLGRPSDPANPASPVEWYPADRLMMWTAALAVGIVTLGALAMGAGSEAFRDSVAGVLERLTAAESGSMLGLPEDADTAALAELFAMVIPPISAAVWMLTMLLNLWIGARIAIASGLLARPMPRISELSYPSLAAPAFAASLLVSFMPGVLGLVGSIAATALFVAYFLLGLVVIHALTRAMAGRIFLLATLYLMILVLIWAIPVVAAVGLADSILRLRARAGGGAI